MALQPSPYSRSAYIDYYVCESSGGKFVKILYRLFPGIPPLPTKDAEQFLTRLTEEKSLTLNHRYFATIDPYYEMALRNITDLQWVADVRGVSMELTTEYMVLLIGEKTMYLPPYNCQWALPGTEVRVTINYDVDKVGILVGSGEEISACDLVKDAHARLEPLGFVSSPTAQEEAQGEAQREVRPCRKLAIFLDPEMKENIEKYPSTIGKERLVIESQVLMYPNSDNWKSQVQELQDMQISSWRKSRGDGSCYYRSVSVSYLESMMRHGNVPELQALLKRVYYQSDYQIHPGYEAHHYYFYDRLAPFLEEFKDDLAIVKNFQPLLLDDAFDNAMIGVFRNLAANWLHNNYNHEEIFPFIMDSGPEPIIRIILTDEMEAEGLAFTAMANALNYRITHIILDYKAKKLHEETFSPFGREAGGRIILVLRPGHYDIVYYAEDDAADGYDCLAQEFRTKV